MSLKKSAGIKIYSSQGQQVLQKNITASSKLVQVDHLPKGLYILEITDHSGYKEIQKLILE